MSNQMLSPVVRIVDDDASVCESQSFFLQLAGLIPAHCALVDLRLIAVVTGNVERAGHFAVAAADALFGRNGDNTVFFVLQTTRRADRNAAGVGAVEAGTASESPFDGTQLIV